MKSRITIRLFGRVSVRCGKDDVLYRSATNAKEILAYLALNRRAPVPRETLAQLITRETSVDRSKKALRQALWQIRADLSRRNPEDARVLSVDGGWVELVMDDRVWLDVAEFEKAAGPPAPTDERAFPPRDVRQLVQAAELYRGELLQGWYQDWCLEERERLRRIYLEVLDKLFAHFEGEHNVDAGVAYAQLTLRTDPARECTHRGLMRLYRLSGDRASALRQYERCVELLQSELGVGPEEETRALEREIRAGRPPLRRHARGAPVEKESRPRRTMGRKSRGS